jgi:DNA-binding SARP family transcriptional activator/streptogramin lyase
VSDHAHSGSRLGSGAVKDRYSRSVATLESAANRRYNGTVEFRILGPLEVRNGRDGVSLDAPKVRALLGVLLLHPNEVVSNERLIDELWGEQPPATAAKIVQTYVSQLRRGLDSDAIATRTPGYVLQVGEEALDAVRFRHLAAEGRRLAGSGEHQQALGIYREALDLWRGPPLANVRFESFARSEVEQLEEERLGALMDLIDCEFALGHHEEVVAELETLVRQHPLRERLRAQLMLALYRCGRQADALASYQEARRTLVDELGLEPSRELQDLEQSILTHDHALTAPRRAAPPLRRRVAWRAPLALVAIGLALATVFAFALGGGHEQRSLQLAPNSVGFIDAKSGRVTKSFPVGREPSALTLTNDSLWVANFRDPTVTQVDPVTGPRAVIPVGGHPTGMVAYRGTVWVWTLEGLLVPIDPRYGSAGKPVSFAHEIIGARSRGGRITTGGGFLWIAARPTTVIRVDEVNPRDRPRFLAPDEGVQGAITYHGGRVWVGGAYQVFPIAPDMGTIASSGANVGVVRDLAFGAGSLWVVSGASGGGGGVVPALRPIDPHTGVVQATIPVGVDPVAVAVAAGSVWVASRSDGIIERVDPAQDRVVDTTRIGASPVALAADKDGVWVAAR